jgi:arylsulfatase A-like enzyme
MIQRARHSLPSALGLALLLLGSCSGPPEPETNVVLIVIDTLRADHLSFYGYEHETAPFLADLAARSTVFENAYSTSSWTAPATASLFTSLHPIQHGVQSGLVATRAARQEEPGLELNRIPSALWTLPEVLASAGYRTYGFSDNLNVSENLGFAQGFDEFEMLKYEGAEAVNRLLRRASRRILKQGAYFLYVHYMDPHFPYNRRQRWFRDADAPELGELRDYDSEIGYVDAKIREMFELFGWHENTLLVVVADHGEEFWDHGGKEHGKTLYSEVLRVPFLVYSSDPRARPGRVSDPVSLLDVLPTLREHAGLPAQEVDEGRSLLPLILGGAEGLGPRSLHASLRRDELEDGKVRRALVRDGWKYILTLPDEEELFDLRVDPQERVNRIDEERARGASMLEEILEFESDSRKFAGEATRIVPDEQTLETLRKLGYVR